jgi:hypothetical protein
VCGGDAFRDTIALGTDAALVTSGEDGESGLPDAALQAALSQVGIGAGAGVSAARDLWSYLPALLALAVGIPDHNAYWKGAVYSLETDAWSNSAHVTAPAVHGLLHAVFHLVFRDADTPMGRARGPAGHVVWLRRFLALAAYGVTHSIAGSGSTKAPAMQLPLLLQHLALHGGYMPRSEVLSVLSGCMLQTAVVRAAVGERGAPPNAKLAPYGAFGAVGTLHEAGTIRRDAKAGTQ